MPRTWTPAPWVIAALMGCTGTVGNPTSLGGPGPNGPDPSNPDPTNPIIPMPVEPTCVTPSPGPAPLRRLSNIEYRYTVEDLLGQSTLAADVTRGFVSETESLGFRNNADLLQVPQVIAQQFMDAAETLATAARSDAALIPCNIARGDAACARTFITDFGRRAYRRPLTTEEITAYETIYSNAAGAYDFATGIEWIVFTMLQSPQFLYRVEFGEPSTAAYTRMDQHEIAARLSYLLWLSMPDQTLFSAAENGALGTKAQIEAQARRMLADPKARRGVQFFEEWLDTDQLSSIQRDLTSFPEFSPELPAAMRDETRRFVEAVVFDGDGKLDTLLTAPFTYVNSTLATHYGVAGPAMTAG